MRARRALLWGSQWVIFYGLWIVLAGAAPAELAVGAAASAVATVASMAVMETHLAQFYAHARWVAQARHLAWLSLTGTGEILAVLAAQLFRGRPAPSLLREVA